MMEQTAHEFASALFNGVYQGMVLAILVWLGFKLFRGANAATRHAVAFVALIAVGLLPVFHLVTSATGREFPTPGGEAALAPSPSEELFARSARLDRAETRSVADTVTASVPGLAGLPLDEELTGGLKALVERERGWTSSPKPSPGLRSGELPAQEQDTPVEPEFRRLEQSPTRAMSFLQTNKVWRTTLPGIASVSILMAIGVLGCARLCRLGTQFLFLARLKRSIPATEGKAVGIFSDVLSEMPVRRSVRLGVSNRVQAPMAIGYRNPMVLLPAALVERAGSRELESVFRHELAHVQRRDDWFNLVQQVVVAVCFFNPAIWWLSRRLTVDREIACDDHALAKSRSPQEYALLLTEFAGRCRGDRWIAAPAAWGSHSQLKERINMILDSKRNTSSQLGRASTTVLTVATLATAAIALLMGPRLVIAASSDAAVNSEVSAASVQSNDDAPDGSSGTITTRAATVPSGTTLSLSSDAKVKSGRSRSVVTLGGGGSSITAPVEVDVEVVSPIEVERHVEVEGEHPGVFIGQSPATPATPATPEAPRGVRPPKAPKPSPVPKPAPSPEFAWHPAPSDHDDDSLERRLERLERLLENLTAEKELGLKSAPDDEPEILLWKEKLKKKDKSPDQGESGVHHQEEILEHAELPPIHVEIQRHIEKAMKDAEDQVARAVREAERAGRYALQHVRGEDLFPREKSSQRVPEFEQQRRMLEQQRHALQKQMERLEREMQDLDEEMERFNRRSDERFDGLKQDNESRNGNGDSREENRQTQRAGEKQKN